MTHPMFKVAIVALPALCGFALSPVVHAHGAERKEAMFEMMDTNGDGKISAEEHAAGAKKMFQTMDADNDSKVTAAEMDAAHEKITGKPKSVAHGHEMSAADKIKMIDSNHDGVLSADEHEAGSKTMFEKMDTDKDGFVTKAEMEAGHAKMMSKSAAKK
jgi:Ca2+-binding EF-hand superfamily protein